MKRLVAAVALALAGPATAGEVRVMWYSDGIEGEVIADLLDRFMAENPGIEVVLDIVAYKVIQEQLPLMLESGEGPDIARVTNLKLLARHWLDLTPWLADPGYWRQNFGDQADWMREDGSAAITGFLTQMTLTGGFANRTLFEQAGVAMPGPGATWDDWAAAARAVAASQGTAAAIAIDRTGHRITPGAVSYGASLIGPDGRPAPMDAGMRLFGEKLVGWAADGTLLRDTWVSASGAAMQSAAEDFANAEVPFYYSGSWQVANLATRIGGGFDWVATGSPCGSAGCSGLAGGAALVAVKYTDNPAEVARVMEFLAREDIVREFSERTLFLPAHKGVAAAGGLDWASADPAVRAALDVFVADAARVLPAAAALPGWKWATTCYGALASRLSQVMAGEMTLEEAWPRIDADIAAAVAAQGG